MHLKILLFCLLLIAFSGSVSAQNLDPDSTLILKGGLGKKCFYGELGGNALVGSLNYEQFFILPGREDSCALRLGVLYYPNGSRNSGAGTVSEFWTFIPVEMVLPMNTALRFGKTRWAAEFAFGATILLENHSYWESGIKELELNTEFYILPTIRFGWRYQPPSKKCFFKASITGLLLGAQSDFQFLPILPVPSIGFGFSPRK